MSHIIIRLASMLIDNSLAKAQVLFKDVLDVLDVPLTDELDYWLFGY